MSFFIPYFVVSIVTDNFKTLTIMKKLVETIKLVAFFGTMALILAIGVFAVMNELNLV